MELVEIENGGAIVGLVRNPVVLPPEPEIDREIGGNFPLILKVGQIERTPKFVAAPGGGEGNSIKAGVYEARVRIAKIEVVVGGLTLIQPNSANLHSGLKGVTTANPGKVVDHTESCAHLMVRVDVVDCDPATGVYGIIQRACLGIDEWGPVDKDFGLIEHPGREGLLQGDKIIRRMVDGLNQVEGNSTPVRSTHKADVPLSASVQAGLVTDLVVHPEQPGVFMDSGRRRIGEQIGVRQTLAGLISESSVRENKSWAAIPNRTSGRAPWESLENGTHLRRRGQGCLLDAG